MRLAGVPCGGNIIKVRKRSRAEICCDAGRLGEKGIEGRRVTVLSFHVVHFRIRMCIFPGFFYSIVQYLLSTATCNLPPWTPAAIGGSGFPSL